jgi:hypothetical protein
MRLSVTQPSSHPIFVCIVSLLPTQDFASGQNDNKPVNSISFITKRVSPVSYVTGITSPASQIAAYICPEVVLTCADHFYCQQGELQCLITCPRGHS